MWGLFTIFGTNTALKNEHHSFIFNEVEIAQIVMILFVYYVIYANSAVSSIFLRIFQSSLCPLYSVQQSVQLSKYVKQSNTKILLHTAMSSNILYLHSLVENTVIYTYHPCEKGIPFQKCAHAYSYQPLSRESQNRMQTNWTAPIDETLMVHNLKEVYVALNGHLQSKLAMLCVFWLYQSSTSYTSVHTYTFFTVHTHSNCFIRFIFFPM